MTLQRSGGASAFSSTADDYARTMAPALRPAAEEVVRRAQLAPGETVVDLGTGTGTAAGLARGAGRRVIGLDAAPGMLEIARRTVPGVTWIEADFGQLPLDDGAVDVVLAAHALLFADDRVATLREWLRVTRRGGRLSCSVPGPGSVVPISIFAPVYRRFGLSWGDDYPTTEEVRQWAQAAGWAEVAVHDDPTIVIPLADDDHYRTWLRVGARGRATADWTSERREELTRALMAASPRDEDGGYRLPFGALYLTARRPE